MNNNKLFFILLPFILMIGNIQTGFSQDDKAEIKIKTEFHCKGGKAKIEKEVSGLEGVSSVVADLETKIVTIQYDSKELNKKKLVKALEATGHRTEFTKANKKIKSGCGSTHKEGDEKNCDDSKE